MVCKLYIRMRLREELVEGQVQWILSYVQEGTTDVWKENVMEELEAREVEYEIVEEFLSSLKKEFGGGEEVSSLQMVDLDFLYFIFHFLFFSFHFMFLSFYF